MSLWKAAYLYYTAEEGAVVMDKDKLNWHILLKHFKKKSKNSGRIAKNREHIKQVKRRKQKEWVARIKNKMMKYKRVLIICGSVVICILFVVGGFGIVRAVGRNRLYNKAQTTQPDMQLPQEEETVEEPSEEAEAEPEPEQTKWKEGWVKYKDKIYEYKEDILTFLVMGIDKNSDVKEVKEGTDGGQADALFLVVVDSTDKSIKIVGINRNSMTDIKIYDEKGEYVDTVKAQIAVQHGFGNGVEESCEYQKEAVEKLFYGLPIHGYAAVNMSAIPTINDAVGGVDVKVLEDLTKKDKSLVKDERVHLMGKSAFWYVQYRDTSVFASADLRLARQKQYLNSFIAAAKKAAKEDISVVLNLYQAVMPQMVTDVSLDEVAYLAPILLDYRFGTDNFYMMEGEMVMGEKFEEFYPDETALYEMILEVFYEEVNLDEEP